MHSLMTRCLRTSNVERTTSKPYPIVLTQLAGLRCVVVGGGEVAVRKVRALLDSGALVTVISPVLHPELAELLAAGQIEHLVRRYEVGDLAGAFLVIAATDRREVNAAVAEEAQQRGMLHNIADDPGASNFHTLGGVQRGDVLLTVSTGGDSPALAAFIRRKLQALFGPEYALVAERLGRLRREFGATLAPSTRTRLWRTLVSDELIERARTGDAAALDRYIDQVVTEVLVADDGERASTRREILGGSEHMRG